MPTRLVCGFHLLLTLVVPIAFGEVIKVGFNEAAITPEVTADRPVWLAGFGHGRRATGVHDPIMARCVVLQIGQEKIALVSLDLIGLQYPEVQRIRRRLESYRYVLVASTHNHQGPDVIGIWGATPLQRGADDEYLNSVVETCVAGVKSAELQMFSARVEYGTARDDTLLDDSREPYVKDGVLRVLKFTRTEGGELGGILVQWNCHPESLGRRNTLITADFTGYTVESLKNKYGCPVAYFSGAVGGLMSNPSNRVRDAAGELLSDGTFEYAEAYGKAVADLASQALEQCEPVNLSPLVVSSRSVGVPIDNAFYRAARELGVLRREARTLTTDADQLGAIVTDSKPGERVAVASEVAYLRLGDLHVASLPGELYPELVYGAVQEPVDPSADYPDAAPEPHVAKLLPGPKWLLFGLANDEIGYIIPRRQWDERPPYCYGRTRAQYGEINSCGPSIAPLLMQALARCVADAATP